MMPPPTAIRQTRRSVPVEIERLEPRCLLAGFATVTEQLVAGGANQEQVVPEGIAGATTMPAAGATSATAATASQGARTDAYVLAAGGGAPEVHVELRWAGGADVGDGSTLVVLDASGATLYTFKLDGVASLQAALDIPAPSGSSPGSFPLDLGLIIRRGDAGSGDPGSYQLALAWQLTSTAASLPSGPPDQVPPGNLAPPGTTPVLAPAATPTLWVTNSLPSVPGAVIGTGVTTGTPVPAPGTLDGSTGSGTTTTTPVMVPDPTATGVLVPTPLPGGSTAGGHAATVPIAGSPAGATPATFGPDRGAATFVGPLPLGPSVPDGGIFASSFNSGSPLAGTGSTHAGPGEFHVPGLATGSVGADLIAGVGRLVSFGPGRDFRVAPPLQQGLPARSGPGPLGEDATRESLAAGAAFLPALATLAAARPGSPATPPPRTRSGDSRRGWINPVVAILAVLTTSAVLVLKLNAPPRHPDWRS